MLLLFVASFHSISLFIVFLIDLGVVLILAASAFVFAQATLIVDGILLSGHKVTMLAVKSILELSI